MMVRIHQNSGVLVEQALVTLHHNFQITLFLEMYPCATVGKRIAAVDECFVERGSHASPDRFVPCAAMLLDVDARVPVPELEFKHVGSRVVPTRNKSCRVILDRLKRLSDVLHTFDTGRIALWSDQHKIVEH